MRNPLCVVDLASWMVDVCTTLVNVWIEPLTESFTRQIFVDAAMGEIFQPASYISALYRRRRRRSHGVDAIRRRGKKSFA
jgi:hypothetical protein